MQQNSVEIERVTNFTDRNKSVHIFPKKCKFHHLTLNTYKIRAQLETSMT